MGEFRWKGTHNVYRLADKAAFETCNFTGAVKIGESSPTVFALPANAAGEMYFGCSVGSHGSTHCVDGQKLAVSIADDTPSSAAEDFVESGHQETSGTMYLRVPNFTAYLLSLLMLAIATE